MRNSEVELKNSTWERNAENFLKLETLNHKSKKLENIKQCKHQEKTNLYILYSNCWKPETKKILKAARTKKYCLQKEKDKNTAVLLIRNYANKTREWYLYCAERKKNCQHRILDSLKKYPSKLKEKYFLSETEKWINLLQLDLLQEKCYRKVFGKKGYDQ